MINDVSKKCLAVLLASLLPLVATTAHGEGNPSPDVVDKLVINYPDMMDKKKPHFDVYFLELLEMAMQNSGVPHVIEPVSLPFISESRSVRHLQSRTYTIHWLNSTAEREKNLIAVKVPLFKGLIGWRLMFIREADQKKFSQVRSLENLRQYTAGLGHDWSDVGIFRFNKMKMVTASNWDGLFKMLPAGRIDYFPRSVIEIEGEHSLFPQWYIEESLVLHYPAAYYFFLSSENAELAKTIEASLLKMIENGDFDKVFNKHYGKVLDKANLPNRRVLRLDSPQEFPLGQQNLWYRLSR